MKTFLLVLLFCLPLNAATVKRFLWKCPNCQKMNSSQLAGMLMTTNRIDTNAPGGGTNVFVSAIVTCTNTIYGTNCATKSVGEGQIWIPKLILYAITEPEIPPEPPPPLPTNPAPTVLHIPVPPGFTATVTLSPLVKTNSP
jgi:hypothetical protein